MVFVIAVSSFLFFIVLFFILLEGLFSSFVCLFGKLFSLSRFSLIQNYWAYKSAYEYVPYIHEAMGLIPQN